jgi:hypothetical protein
MRLLFAVLFAASICFAEGALQVPVWPGEGILLAPATVAATINGSEAGIVSVKGPSDDLMLLVVLDFTDDLAAVTQARNALTSRIAMFPPNFFVGVMAAQNGLSVIAPPSADREAIAKALLSHPVGGRAGLLNTIEQAARLASQIEAKTQVRLAVLYVTDSDISNYRENYNNAVVNSSDRGDLSRQVSDTLVRERISRMITSLAATRAPVFISQLTYKNDQLNNAYQTGMLALAGATGGSAIVSRSVAEIPTAIGELMDRITAHYSVGVSVPSGSKSELAVKLEARPGGPLTHRSNFVIAD